MKTSNGASSLISQDRASRSGAADTNNSPPNTVFRTPSCALTSPQPGARAPDSPAEPRLRTPARTDYTPLFFDPQAGPDGPRGSPGPRSERGRRGPASTGHSEDARERYSSLQFRGVEDADADAVHRQMITGCGRRATEYDYRWARPAEWAGHL